MLSNKEKEVVSLEQKLEKALSEQQTAQQADDQANQQYQALSLGVTNAKLQTASLAQQVISNHVCNASVCVCVCCVVMMRGLEFF